MIKQLFKLFLCSCVLALGLLSTMVNAKDFKYFSLDYGPQWMVIPAEDPNQAPNVEVLVLLNTATTTTLSITVQDTGKSLSKEEFKQNCEKLASSYEIGDMHITSTSFNDATGEYTCLGNAAGLPFEIRISQHDKISLSVLCMGPKPEEGFALAEKIRIK